MYKITGSHKGRMQVAEELAEIVNEGDRIIDAAMGQIRALFGNKTDPQVITDLLAEMAQTGKLKITGRLVLDSMLGGMYIMYSLSNPR